MAQALWIIVMARFSEDVDVRCYSCNEVMGSVTVRSDSEAHLSKMKFMNESRTRCRTCDQLPNTRQSHSNRRP
jgi:hypothetical protein